MVSSKILALALSIFALVAAESAHEDSSFAGASHLAPRSNSSSSSSSATSSSGFVSGAYFANWDSGYSVSDIPIQHLSHIYYAFANIGSDGTVSVDDGTDSKNLQQLFALKGKNRKLKTMLSLGGGGAAGWKHISTGSFTDNFVKSAVGLVTEWGLDGLDLDYEFPSSSTIDAYAGLIQALRKGLDTLSSSMNTTPFSLSLAVAGDIKDGTAYEQYTKQIDAAIDYWNVMAYDLCASNYQSTACDVGNLSGGSTSGSGTIQWFINNGATASKMVLGSPLYGYVYGGTSGHDQSYVKSKTPKGDGDNGPGGYGVKYFPISSMKNAAVTEDEQTGASWAYDKNTQTLASYDTPKIAGVKADWVMKQQIGGAMYWEISSDAEGDASLVATYGNAFIGGGGLHSACNHISFPKSSNGSVKNGSSNASSCDDSEPNTGASDTTTPSSSSSGSGQCSVTNTRRRAKRHHSKRRVSYNASM